MKPLNRQQGKERLFLPQRRHLRGFHRSGGTGRLAERHQQVIRPAVHVPRAVFILGKAALAQRVLPFVRGIEPVGEALRRNQRVGLRARPRALVMRADEHVQNHRGAEREEQHHDQNLHQQGILPVMLHHRHPLTARTGARYTPWKRGRSRPSRGRSANRPPASAQTPARRRPVRRPPAQNHTRPR